MPTASEPTAAIRSFRPPPHPGRSRSCSAAASGPELGHAAQDGDPPVPDSPARAARAARIDSGLALYASLTTVTPSSRRVTSIRHRLLRPGRRQRAATSAGSSRRPGRRPRPTARWPPGARRRPEGDRVRLAAGGEREPGAAARRATRRRPARRRPPPGRWSARVRGCAGHADHPGVVGVEDGGAVVRERLDEFALGHRDRRRRCRTRRGAPSPR